VQKTTTPMTGADQRRAARIDQVLDAASSCFVEYGFHQSGMAKIAKRADMSVGHIYHYFQNKEAIIAAIVDRESAKVAEKFSELDAADPEDLACLMAERITQSLRAEADNFQSVLNLEMLAECQRNPEIAKIVRRHDDDVRQRLVQLIGGKLQLDDAEARTDMMMTLFGGFSTRMLRHPNLDRERLVPAMRRTLAHILSPGKLCSE